MGQNYDPRAKLDEWGESLLSLGMIGGRFAEYAASNLAGYARDARTNHEVRYWILVSCFNRKDKEAAIIYVNDWAKYRGKPLAIVSKFIPGEHYHVLGTKFDTLEAAQDYLRGKGYVYDCLVEKHVYTMEGD